MTYCRPWLVGAGLAAAVAFGVPPLAGSAAADSAPLGTVTVNPTSASTLGDALLPLAGDASWLVYQRSTQVVANNAVDGTTIDTGEREVTLPDYPASRVIEARSASGVIQVLTTKRVSDTNWSVAGNTVVAARPVPDGEIDWWNLAQHSHGVILGKTADTYLSAAPGGYFYSTGTTLERRSVRTKKSTSYGKVLPHGYPWTITGPAGVVIGSSRYIPFAKPHKPVALRTTGTDGDPVVCTGSSARYAACYRFSDDDDDATPSADIVVPLNGGKPTVSTTCPGWPSIAGDTVVWATGTGFAGPATCVSAGATIDSLTAGASRVSTSSTVTSSLTTSAYGAAIFSSQTLDSVISATNAATTTTILSTPTSRTTVGSFALSPGQITDTDDAPDASHPTHPISVRTSALSSDGEEVGVGTPVVHSGDNDSPVDGRVVAASGTTTAYAVADPATAAAEDLRVVSAAGATTIPDIDPTTVTVSGNRVLYATAPAGAGPMSDWKLLDLSTGSTTDIATLSANRSERVALWGNYVVYPGTHTVRRKDLTTGISTAVQSFKPSVGASGFEEYADHVLASSGCADTVTDLTDSSTITVNGCKGTLLALHLSPAGVIYDNGSDWVLRRWSGTNVTLLNEDATLHGVAPQIGTRALAWLTPKSNLDIAPLNIADPPPVYLGAAIAPATLAVDSGPAWEFSAAFSTALRSCSVTLAFGPTVLRTLACVPADAALGVATVTWDGRDGDGALVGAGTYTWRVNAAGDSGAAVNYDGSATPVSGTIAVTS